MKTYASFIIVLLMLVGPVSADTVIKHVGNRKQLFIDHKFIDSEQNITLRPNPPEKLPKPVIKSDKPWEAFSLTYFSVVHEDGKFRMWYQAWMEDYWLKGNDTSKVCYAESRDGKNWVKPNLGLVEFNGSKDNNIVLDGGLAARLAYVFKDTNPKAPASQRYKMLWGLGQTSIRTSPDGIHWSEPGPVVWDYSWDTQKQAWWDEDLGKYVIYVRSQVSKDTTNPSDLPFPFVDPIPSDPPVVDPNLYRGLRMLARVETADILQQWPSKNCRTIFCGDELDPPHTDFYHSGGVYKYPYADDAYFMFPWIYESWPHSSVYNDGVINGVFAASRNGWNWMRYDRKVYIPRGVKGEMDYGCAQPLGPLFRDGDFLYQFYSGWPWTHGGWRAMTAEEKADRTNWGLSEYRLNKYRLDGFVSADAPAGGGWLLTPPLKFDGNRLVLNIETLECGSARVAILDADGNPLPGFSIDDCALIQTDDVDYIVTWNGESDVSSLANTSVRLRFEMTSTKLYAFQFIAEPSTRSPDR